METKIPGIKGTHRIVTQHCMKRPELEVIAEVEESVRSELSKLIKTWKGKDGVEIHIVVTVDY